MEIIGKVVQVLPIQGGTSASSGKAWQVETFIIETIENYPRKVAIEIFGEERIKNNPVVEGQVYTISFDLESREFNGRWYTSARAWKVVAGVVQQPVVGAAVAGVAPAAPQPVMPQAMPTVPQSAPAPQSFDSAANNMLGDNSDLPF